MKQAEEVSIIELEDEFKQFNAHYLLANDPTMPFRCKISIEDICINPFCAPYILLRCGGGEFCMYYIDSILKYDAENGCVYEIKCEIAEHKYLKPGTFQILCR